MKWYEILAEDAFVDYFCDDSNVITILTDGEEQLAPMFERYRQTVKGVAWGYAVRLFERVHNQHCEMMHPDFNRGFMACSELAYGKKVSIPEFAAAASRKLEAGATLCDLSPEELAADLMFNFFSRMGSGSFEIAFQKSGQLKEYIIALKAKIEAESKQVAPHI